MIGSACWQRAVEASKRWRRSDGIIACRYAEYEKQQGRLQLMPNVGDDMEGCFVISAVPSYHTSFVLVLATVPFSMVRYIVPEAASLSMQGCYSHGPVDTPFRIVRAAAATAPRW
jgi:hypothetical protein